jgi:hypothetical protein
VEGDCSARSAGGGAWQACGGPGIERTQLWHDVDDFDAEKRMGYVTSFEQIGIEKGIANGIEKGIETGLRQGELLGQAALLGRQLTRRFGPLQPEHREQLGHATREQLETWGDRMLDAASPGEVFGGH